MANKPDPKTMHSDALLLERVRQGDQASFEALFRRHYGRVYGLLYRLVGNREDAEELAQEVFVKLYRRPLRRSDNVGGWLYRVATNLGYNSLRSGKRRAKYEQASIDREGRSSPSAAIEAERQLEGQAVRATLARLKPRQAQLLLLRQMGFSYKELADTLGVAPSSVGTLLVRAEKAFRRAYGGGRDG